MALTKASLIDLNANELILDLDADTSITADTDDTIHFKIGGTDRVTIAGSALSPSSSDGSSLGTTALEWSDLFLADGAVINFGDDQDVSLTHVADTGLLLSSTDQLQFGDSGTYIHQSADGVLDLVSDTEIEINATTIDMNGALDVSGTITSGGVITGTGFTIGSAVIAEAELELIDGLTAGTAIASKVVTTDANIDSTGMRNLTLSGELDAATLDISGNADIDGTTNLDVVDIDGATQIDATVTVGVDDTGYDVKFFGATSGAYMLWDESVDDLILAGAAGLNVDGQTDLDVTNIVGALTVGADDSGHDVIFYGDTASANMTWDTSADDLILNGAARIVVPDGQLVLGSTAVTSTAAELNLLDGVSGLVQADFTKLAAVDSTAAELNIVDGGTSATSTTVADADRVVMNDNGTMVQVAVTDLAAYFDDEITAMPNLVTTAATTVGALDSGSITSGFGNIDNGASNITTGGLLKIDVDADANDVTGDSATGRLTLGAGEDLNLYHGGTDSYIVNDTGDLILKTGASDEDILFQGNDGGSAITALTLDMSDSGAASFNGVVTADAGVVVDNITIDGTEIDLSSGNLTVDVAGDIILDADDGRIRLSDAGTEWGQLQNSSSDFVMFSSVSDKDIILKGNDGGSTITALTLDMSDAGAATFNDKVTLGDGKLVLNSTAVTSTAAELNKLDGAGTILEAGKHTIWVPANAMTPTKSNGCSALTSVETTAGRPDMVVLDFDNSSDEHAQFTVAFPKSWDEGTVTFQVFWSSNASSDGCSWGLQGVAIGDNDSIDVAYGTAVVVDDSALGAVEEICVSPESSAITIAGSPAVDQLCYFRIFRDVSDGNDTMSADGRLHGIKLFYTTDAKNDS